MAKQSTRLEDLAKRAGVSISTASRALNDSPAVNLQTKQLIWKLARELDYPFRRYMPAGPSGAVGAITVVTPRPQAREGRLADPFFLELVSAIGEAARARGCNVTLSHLAPSTYEELSFAMTTQRADGVIVIGQSFLHAALNRLAEDQQRRFIVWGAELSDQQYCSIGSDNVAGARRATAHLIRLGRRRIVFLGHVEAPEPAQRHRGYVEALTAAGLDVDPDLEVRCHFDVESAQATLDALIDAGIQFDGVVAASDLIALGAMRALSRRQRPAPEAVSVVGYDNIAIGRWCSPPLSTIDQNVAEAGRLMIAKLLDARDGRLGASERVSTELIVRGSCGA